MLSAAPTTLGVHFRGTLVYLHGVAASGKRVVRRCVRRVEIMDVIAGLAPCTVGIEDSLAAHYWARCFMARGHKVRMVPNLLRSGANRGPKARPEDCAAAICRAARDRTVNFLPILTLDEQIEESASDCSELLYRQRRNLSEALRRHLERYGIFLGHGAAEQTYLLATVEDDDLDLLPSAARAALRPIATQIRSCDRLIAALEAQRANPTIVREAPGASKGREPCK